ncbi:hypothetical protein GQ44DRAFT_605759 [Phaeosphaeriaceae sp. PMI808]|nr:hypothetical protein GQ44DRAFT_605759 [Phaeosphaeriaceae sp. PMI808]
MSFSGLPKEIRLQIWELVYFSQSPRLVTLRTKKHNREHDKKLFCPRYSPSPAPTVVNICHEARAEAFFQARRAGHIIRLLHDPIQVPSQEPIHLPDDFYFRFETDIFYLALDDDHVDHLDDSPEMGFLAHLRWAAQGDTTRLRNVALTRVIDSGYHDGSVPNNLRDFPAISSMFMVGRDVDLGVSLSMKQLFVYAARRIVALYRYDVKDHRSQETVRASESGVGRVSIEVEFVKIEKGELEIVPKQTWKTWSKLGCGWVTTDTAAQFYETLNM